MEIINRYGSFNNNYRVNLTELNDWKTDVAKIHKTRLGAGD